MVGRMRKSELLKHLDVARIEAALHAAEKRTAGELRVSVSPFFWGDVRLAAEQAFERLGMTQTRARNAVLFFVVPSRKKFVVLGDSGIHEKVGQPFWDGIAGAMQEKFRVGDFTGGLVAGIEHVAEALASHFPWTEADVNELPNEVDFGAPERKG